MPSLKQISRRIVGVKNTAQITRAMKMVAAARLRRAQENMENARPYAWKLRDVIASLAARTSAEKYPLLEVRDPQRIGIVTVTSDRGLCGSFNLNICRKTQQVLSEFPESDVQLFTLGKKGYDFLRKREVKIYHNYPGVFQELEFSQAAAIGGEIVSHYHFGDFDRIYLVYNEFKNVAQQNIISEQLLPIIPHSEMTASLQNVDYIYEPDEKGVLDKMLPMHINIQIWRVMLESYAAEQAARMTAMENATNNAKEMVDDLTLLFNKARQSAITKELLEIVSGAECLK
ncbi:MAG: ATP synthase F1 subunit gamma [Candidatus Hatepunaea meridiana]|nr:ATP synthase F1 subunit gamma [Candidatus Hatepunaea meridiana]